MTTKDRMEKGASLKREMNCCQAVLRAFADTVDMTEPDLMRIGSGFGSGMATMEGSCGALVGAVMISSLRAKDVPARQLSRQIITRFKELCGATACRDLKGIDAGKPLCSCEDCVRNAILAADEALAG